MNGRIDANSASEADAKIKEICVANPCETTVIDADNLEYISSAGLRIVLRLLKENPSLKIVNASSECYEIFDMTGFTDMMTVEKAYRRLSVEGCKIIGAGAKGTVYRYNSDTIVKVYKDKNCLPAILNERELAKKAFVMGIPTAISYDVVRVGDSYGSVFELLEAKSYSELIAENPQRLDEYVKICADLLKQIHQTPVKSGAMANSNATALKWAQDCKPYLSEADGAKLIKLAEELPEWNYLQHGDFHTNNIMLQGEETMLIDMDTLASGYPITELANIFVAYVGFGIVDKAYLENFMGFSAEISQSFWNGLLKEYFHGLDDETVRENSDKIRLLGFARLLRHTARRDSESRAAKQAIAFYKENIEKLIKNINTLKLTLSEE